jgi:broad specificity phosphatase PhoE
LILGRQSSINERKNIMNIIKDLWQVMKKIFLVTRGITVREENNLFSRENSQLSNQGILQIEKIGELLNIVDYENIFCSRDLASMDSGEIIRIKNIFGKKITFDNNLKERIVNHILNEENVYKKYIKSNFLNFNVGESGILIYNRLKVFVNNILKTKGDNIVVSNPENITMIIKILGDDMEMRYHGKMIMYELS